MRAMKTWLAFSSGIFKNNPTFRLVLGLCPTLAVTTSLENALGMGLAATFVLVCSNGIISALRKLKDGNGQYLWQPSLVAGTPNTILGCEVISSPFMPNIEAGAKTITFGDYSYYWIADRTGRTFKRLNELFATTGQVGFLGSQRVDGKLILPEAIKVLKLKGSGT